MSQDLCEGHIQHRVHLSILHVVQQQSLGGVSQGHIAQDVISEQLRPSHSRDGRHRHDVSDGGSHGLLDVMVVDAL